MELRTEDVKFKNRKTITVTQENWDVSMTLSDELRKAVESPSEDKRFQYFKEKIYPYLFSPSFGDVPGIDEAYQMVESDPDSLNEWYMAIQRANPDWFEWLQHHTPETVAFSDKTILYVIDGNVPAGMMKIWDLENLEIPEQTPPETSNQQIFRMVFYPKLAAASVGEVPSVLAARKMPTMELNKWYEAVSRVNPQWFKPLQDLQKQKSADELKKEKRDEAAQVRKWFKELFSPKTSPDALPVYFDFTLDEFHKYKGNWLLYRSMGHLSDSGQFIPPITYAEAQSMPKRAIEMFMKLDDIAEKILKQMKK